MPTPNAAFHPPYLKYKIPSDLEKIQNVIESLRDESLAKKPVGVKNTPKEIQNSRSQALKTATLGVNVSPNGVVSMGFNCKITLHASNNFDADTCYWQLHFKNKVTGQFDQVQFMGGTSTKTTHKHEIVFDMDYDTYNQDAYVTSPSLALGGPTGGFATFKVFCSGWNYAVPILNTSGLGSLPGPTVLSDEITLDFNGKHCIVINSMSLSTDSVKGGDNGKEPTLTVNISDPAPPGGITVLLSVSPSNTNLGRIMRSGRFQIPGGKKSDSISWFLGTRKVYATGNKFDIVAQLLFPDGNTSPKGYAKIKLTK